MVFYDDKYSDKKNTKWTKEIDYGKTSWDEVDTEDVAEL